MAESACKAEGTKPGGGGGLVTGNTGRKMHDGFPVGEHLPPYTASQGPTALEFQRVARRRGGVDGNDRSGGVYQRENGGNNSNPGGIPREPPL